MDSDLSTFERDIKDADDEIARLEAEIVRKQIEIARIGQRRSVLLV